MAGFIFKKMFKSNRQPVMIHGGSLLLRKGLGSSYRSPEEYRQIVGNGLYSQNHGCGLADKLSRLEVKTTVKRPKNIRF